MDNQDLESFVLAYHEIECVKMKDEAYKGLLKPVDAINELKLLNKSFKKAVKYIELRSINSLTDKEAKRLGFEDSSHCISSFPYKNELVDKIRKLGIAYWFRGIPLPIMIQKGFLKLKS